MQVKLVDEPRTEDLLRLGGAARDIDVAVPGGGSRLVERRRCRP